MTDEGEKKLVSTWESLIKNNEGEAEIHELHKYIVKRDPESLPPLPQAEAPSIRTTRRRLAETAFNKIFVFGDAQIGYRETREGQYEPIHDERALAVARAVAREFQPTHIVNLSDHVDLAKFGKYDADSNQFDRTTQMSLNRGHLEWKLYRAEHPQARDEMHEVDSNHTVRIARFIGRQAMELYGLRQAGTDPNGWHMTSYPYLMNLDSLGVQFHSGYAAAEYPYKPDMVFAHGNELRSNGSTAEMLSKKYPYANRIVGHGHSIERHTRTLPDGRYFTYIQNGCLCLTTGEVPGYGTAVDDRGRPVRKQMNWQQSVTLVIDHDRDNPDRGDYEFIIVPIRDGVAHYNNKTFTASEIIEGEVVDVSVA